MLTTFSERAHAARAPGGGATGFLPGAGDPYELVAGTRAVAGGAAFLSPTVARCVVGGLGGTGRPARRRRPACVAANSATETRSPTTVPIPDVCRTRDGRSCAKPATSRWSPLSTKSMVTDRRRRPMRSRSAIVACRTRRRPGRAGELPG
ncbi:hypothetical protein GCM10019016_045920 [Streptomyces prasinosporus]|uniref:Uncharacterized protein n=1 Tax=Streptomyces prasinosporus TaxID=68256 RepID=A0ABP6TQA8_9ACTN